MKKIILLSAICSIGLQVQSQSWNLTGNAGTNASTNFIGTLDNIPFKIRTNNAVRVTVNGSGKVGIGISSPVFKLDVKGGSINTDSVYRIGGNTVLSVKGNGNFFSGINSGFSITTGTNNTAIGKEALYSNTSGHHNTANGMYALHSNTTGSYNTANGKYALTTNITGSYNTANGAEALLSNKGSYNTANGVYALYDNTTGSSNTANGFNALFSNTTGGSNTATGRDALYSNTTGDVNTANGYGALYSNTEGRYNTANGFYALYSNTEGEFNTANGMEALYSNTTGSFNTATGFDALQYNTTGFNNTAYGIYALSANGTGSYNTANGHEALDHNNTGVGNTGSGYQALYYNTTGNHNSSLGYSATFVTGALDNTSCIGYFSGGIVNASNRIELGNTSVSVIAGQVGFSTYSDARIKDDVKEDVPGLAFISKLRPVTYHLNIHRENAMIYKKKDEADWATKYDIEKIKMTGFLAQDVEKAAKETGYDFSGVQIPANPDELYSLRYSDFVMPLVKAVQELNEELKMKNEKLESEIALIKKVMTAEQQLKLSELKNDNQPHLEQNSPNPFKTQTEIKFQLPGQFHSALLVINDESGKQIRTCNVQSSTSVIIKEGELPAGTYSYSLIIDGIIVDTKQMLLTK